MSSLTALAKVYEVQSAQSTLTFEEARKVAKASSGDAFAHDYEGAEFLHRFDLQEPTTIWSEEWIRGIIKQLVISGSLPWKRAILKGRSHVIRHLTENERQVFQAAGLCVDNPDNSVVLWWDELQNLQRAELTNSDFREWELRSLNFENERLEQSSCPHRARWKSIDDNTCGYDIESFEMFENEWIAVAIEVKSRYEQEIVFEMSRNECNQMVRMGKRYSVHYWSKPEGHLRILQSENLIKNLPTDGQSSNWTSTEFSFERIMFPAVDLKSSN